MSKIKLSFEGFVYDVYDVFIAMNSVQECVLLLK